MSRASQELERVLAYCGLSSSIGVGVLRRALSDAGVDPDRTRPTTA